METSDEKSDRVETNFEVGRRRQHVGGYGGKEKGKEKWGQKMYVAEAAR
jgi:hypothetical protein